MTNSPFDADDAGIAPPGYRLPPPTRPGPVHLQVADRARSVAWYGRVLGLAPLREEDGATVLGAPATQRPLVFLHERPGARPVPARGRLGLYHFALLLPDEAALGRFIAHLASTGERAGASDHLVSEALYLRDPDGLGIEIYADRPRAEWQRQGREIRMDTRPLDVDRVVAAARGAPWAGMPAGTVVGHVHLHVGDLARGADFYHDGLGLDRMVWSYPGALFLAAGGYHHHLGINGWAGEGATPPGEGDARLLEWTLELPDASEVVSAAASLAARGHPVRDGRVADPWGTVLRLAAASS